MKIRNKKTGEIVDIANLDFTSDNFAIWLSTTKYSSLAELNEEWEDYEEPKEYWYMSCDGRALKATTDEDEYNEKHNAGHKLIGNYFETKEEAERAVEKLKAWKRLKDKGFKLKPVVDEFFCLDIFMKGEPYEAIKDDLKIVFGGEK